MIKVGLFVNATVDDACRTFDSLPLDLIQLHGDEPPEFLQRLGTRPAMRAFRVGTQGLEPVLAYLEACRQLGRLPRLTLIDAQVAGAYGGTGQVADWRAIEAYGPDGHGGSLPPLVLAGGLTPGNVAEAIRTVRPAAVDTASGVESSPGKKDPKAIAEFVRAAHEAFADL